MRLAFTGSPFGLLAGAIFTLLLAYACLSDLRTRRIPNQLTLALAVTGVAYSIGSSTLQQGLVNGLAAMIVGLLFWLPFWLLGWLGAGDVKLFAGAAAWLGPWGAVQAAGIGAIVGAVLALAWLGWEYGSGVAMKKSLHAILHPRVLDSPARISKDRRRLLPYGVALSIGLLVAAWYPSLLFF